MNILRYSQPQAQIQLLVNQMVLDLFPLVKRQKIQEQMVKVERIKTQCNTVLKLCP